MKLDQRIRLLRAQIDRFSRVFYTSLLSVISDKLKIKDDKITFNNANVGIIAAIEQELKGKIDPELERIKRYTIKTVRDYVRQESNIYNEIGVRAIESSNKVIQRLEKHLTTKVEQITDLSTIYGEVKSKSINLMSKHNGVSLQELREMLEKDIIDKDKIQSYWSRWTYDIYQNYERVAANEIRKDLGLTWALYEGGEIDTSRCFCIKRNGRLFNETEINSWADETWPGKSEIGYDPIVDLGGFNCRHRLRWVSDEFAERMEVIKGINNNTECDEV